MNWQQFLFSPRGRVGRQHYWLMVLITLPFFIAASLTNGGFDHVLDPPGVFWTLLIVWPSLAVTIKRWHDRNKSGWWYFINFIPVIGVPWALVENGFLKGTTGENRFGPDPLEQEAQQSLDRP